MRNPWAGERMNDKHRARPIPPPLNAYELRFLNFLVGYWFTPNKHSYGWLPAEAIRIKVNMGMSIVTARRTLEALRERGLVSKKPAAGNLAALYRLRTVE